jgi:hypothetical protein
MSAWNDLLLTETGRGRFDRHFAQLIRDGDLAAADALLSGLLAERPSPLAEICFALPAETVELDGWAQLAVRVEEISANGETVTAVGVDLTSHSDAVDASGWRVQKLETNYYTDAAFPFSSSSRDEILAGSGPEGSEWQGHFAEIDAAVSITGLNRLNDALAEASARGATGPSVALAEWFRHLRFHQAASRGLERHGTPRAIPLLVGSNEIGPWVEAVYYPSKAASVAVQRRVAARPDRQRMAEAYARQTEADVSLLRGTRSELLSSRWKRDPAGFEIAARYAMQYEDVHFRHSPAMNQFAHCHLLPDGEFELYVEAYRQQREAYRTGSPLPTSKPARAAGRG